MIENFSAEGIAILYQATKPPVIDGIRKPMKPGGYSDSGADIAYILAQLNIPVVKPVYSPDPRVDLDWVFPDTEEGIRQAISKGATVLWANTILFKGHALEKISSQGIQIVGQIPAQVHTFDDKWITNLILREAGCPVARSILVSIDKLERTISLDKLNEQILADFNMTLPAIIKPLRGRGSQGVVKVNDFDQLQSTARKLLSETITADDTTYLKYGNTLILEEYLPSTEVTFTVMPPGMYRINDKEHKRSEHWVLPPVERFNHQDGITPYNGVVAVTQNSHALHELDEPLETLASYCALGASLVGAVAPIRIDCRARNDGQYRMFDLNMKPNMTGAGRPGRDDQDSLSCMAARVIGWSYGDLLVNMLRQAWDIDTLSQYQTPVGGNN